MKVYKNNKKNNKSWSLKLVESPDNCTYLEAVNSETGQTAATLLVFHAEGKVKKVKNAYESLLEEEFDPFEHKNTFDENGALVIS
jgi:hypothetical protein